MTGPIAASRPWMPGYGLQPAETGLLPWAWAEERLAASRNYWVCTVSEDGRPHSMPVWGVWREGALWFSTGAGTRKARNLERDARCTVTTEGAAEAVVLEALASLVRDVPTGVPVAYAAKYGQGYPPSAVFAVRPQVAFGFIEQESQFGATATRWRFAAASPRA